MMNNIRTILAIAAILTAAEAFGQTQPAQPKRFVFDQKTMTEAGLSAEQIKAIEENRSQFRKVRTVYEAEIAKYNALETTRLDSLFSSEQKQKIEQSRQGVAEENKANPAVRKYFVLDPKTMDQLGLPADLQKKVLAIRLEMNARRRTLTDTQSKVTAKAVQEQEDVLTAEQKKKVEELKAAIAEYNKNL
ncbi:MAG: hypothetical protein ABWY16_19670 [Pedobacter sp.]|uniref:hypothetical protein n=1 Tax=Pedobacter sp. TaxID=1411316 RepID=UPI003397CE0C